MTTLSAQAADLKVAVDPTYEPFTYKTPDGKPTGFDVDIANAVCEQIKRKCVFVEQVWDSMIPGLQAKKYDVIVSSLSMTDERRRVIDFSDRYYKTPSAIVVKKGTAYTGPASLKGKRIGVLKGSTQEKWAMGELKPAGVTVVPYEAQDQVYLTSSRAAWTVRWPTRWKCMAASCASLKARTMAMWAQTSTRPSTTATASASACARARRN